MYVHTIFQHPSCRWGCEIHVQWMCGKFRTGIHPLTSFYFNGWLSILSIRMENPSKSWHFEFGWFSIMDLTGYICSLPWHWYICSLPWHWYICSLPWHWYICSLPWHWYICSLPWQLHWRETNLTSTKLWLPSSPRPSTMNFWRRWVRSTVLKKLKVDIKHRTRFVSKILCPKE